MLRFIYYCRRSHFGIFRLKLLHKNAVLITHDATIHTPEYWSSGVVVMKPENKLWVYCSQQWWCFPSRGKRVITKVESFPKTAHNVSELHVVWRWFVQSPSYCWREGWRKRWDYGLQRWMQIAPPIGLLWVAYPGRIENHSGNFYAFIFACRIWTSAICSLGTSCSLHLRPS